MSLVFYSIVMIFVVYLIKTLISKSRVTISKTESVMESYYNIPEEHILNKDMFMAIQLVSNHTTVQAQNEVTLRAFQNNYSIDNATNTRILNAEELQMEL